jgi:glutathione S-transferase
VAELTLYKFDACPFCRKVMAYIDEAWPKDKPIAYRDVRREADAYDELLRIGGMTQVPCLVIDGVPLYESDDIVAWLAAHKDE